MPGSGCLYDPDHYLLVLLFQLIDTARPFTAFRDMQYSYSRGDYPDHRSNGMIADIELFIQRRKDLGNRQGFNPEKQVEHGTADAGPVT